MRWPPLAPADAVGTDAGDGDSFGKAAALGPRPAPPIEIGGVVEGKYRIERVLGFGGMGIVCAATHLELGTPIAIKFVRPERGSDERTVARFLTEARAAAQLQSQYTCRVMDCGRLPSGSPYLVMEYLVGQDLRALVSETGPLDIDRAVSLTLQACEALAEAHGKHIVHRDVKPENLFMAEGPGRAPLLKVLDFGISKQLSPLVAQRSLTDSTESMGSPFHMSPEQMIDPASVDSRTDIWSLGVVLYEILTGQLPFAGETGPQLCANVMTTEPISPRAHRDEIPEHLARVVLRCLEKDRQRRFHDVGELSLALGELGGAAAALAAARVEQILGRTTPSPDAVVETEGAVTVPPSSAGSPLLESIPGVPRRGSGWRVGVVLILLAAIGLLAYAFRRALVPASADNGAPAPVASITATASEAVPPPPQPAASASASARPKKRARPDSTPTPAPAPERPANSGRGAIVYPTPPPIPDMRVPDVSAPP